MLICVCAYNCAELSNTAQNSSDIFPLILQTVIIAHMMSTGGELFLKDADIWITLLYYVVPPPEERGIRRNTVAWSKCQHLLKITTRPVAVYLGTHCNIGSKRPCCFLASDIEPSHVISTVHLWFVARSLCRRSRIDIVVTNCCRL